MIVIVAAMPVIRGLGESFFTCVNDRKTKLMLLQCTTQMKITMIEKPDGLHERRWNENALS